MGDAAHRRRQRLGVRFLVLDAARRLSIKTDEGPAKVRELIAALRSIVTEAGRDHRHRPPRREAAGERAGSPPPEPAGLRRRLVRRLRMPGSRRAGERHREPRLPPGLQVLGRPDPFTFTCVLDGKLIKALVGVGTTTEHAETAGERGRLLAWLATRPAGATKTDMRRAGFSWRTLDGLLDGLERAQKIDSGPGRTAGSTRYFVVTPTIPEPGDGSTG